MSMFATSDASTGKFLKLKNGETVALKFVGLTEKMDVPSQYTNEDGSFGSWEFTRVADGSPCEYTHKSKKNAVHIALEQAGIKEGDTFELSRAGEGTDTRYEAKKLVEGTNAPAVAPF